MKIYTFYTPSHEIFFREWFQPTFKDDVEIVCKKFEQKCISGDFMSNGWNQTMLDKLDYILEALDDPGDYFIHADCDIQFFDNIVNDLTANMKQCNVDILAQSDGLGQMTILCAGFFMAKKSQKLKSLVVAAKKLVAEGLMSNDQAAINALLFFGGLRIKFAVLNHDYFSIFMANGGETWQNSQNFDIPSNIKLHHANWTSGIDKKLSLLKLVREKYRQRNP